MFPPCCLLVRRSRNLRHFASITHAKVTDTIPKSTEPQVQVEYPPYSPYPNLTVQLSSGQLARFSLRPWHTVSSVLSSIIEEDSTLTNAVLLSSTDNGAIAKVKWSGLSNLEDVLRSGLRSISKTGSSSLFLKMNNKLVPVEMPNYEVRVSQYQLDMEELHKKLRPLHDLKTKCDIAAGLHANRLVWAGLGGLLAQWAVLTRATWWEYSWDVIEPITWFVNTGNSVLAYVFFVIYRRDFSCEALSTITATRRQLLMYKKMGLDIKSYDHLRQEVKEIEDLMEKAREEYE